MRKRPSNLTKLTKRSKNITNSIIVGDIYDTSTSYKNTVDQLFVYNTNVESGYIFDKQGNKYDVLCTSAQNDCGRIAGAGMDYHVKINYNDTILSLKSYLGIMSKSTGDKLISTLKDGIYLEDYLKLYLSDVNFEHRDMALQILSNDSKPSVLDEIRTAAKMPKTPNACKQKERNKRQSELE